MSHGIRRSEPPYIQIAEYYRRLIQDGTLAEGDRLPSVRQLAAEWGVVRATANRSVKYLEAAQLIEPTKTGTHVRRRAAPAPRDRVLRRPQLESEDVEVTDAGQVTRGYVAQILGLADNAALLRREQITYRRDEPITLSVHWLPGSFADNAPELQEKRVLDTLAIAHRATGRRPTIGSDRVSSRYADQREADALGLTVGAAVLAGAWTYSDDQGIIEYGEYVAPPEHVVTYDYDIAAYGQGDA